MMLIIPEQSQPADVAYFFTGLITNGAEEAGSKVCVSIQSCENVVKNRSKKRY